MKIRGPNNTTKQLMKDENVIEKLTRCLCASTGRSSNEIADRVIGLVKKFDRIDACKVISPMPPYHLIFDFLSL